MKLVFKVPLSLALTAVALTGLSLAQDWYVSGQLQWQQQGDSDNSGAFTSDFTTGAGTTIPAGTVLATGTTLGWNTELKDGIAGSVEVGRNIPSQITATRQLPKGFRGSLELAFESADVEGHSGVTAGGGNIDAEDADVLVGSGTQLGASVGAIVADGQGKIENTSVFANLYYDWQLGSLLKPYIGAGIGVTNTDVKFNPSGVAIADDSETNFAYQAKLGASVKVRPNLELFGEYTYRATDDVEVELDLVPGNLEIENERHLVGLGFRYRFGG